MVFLDFLNVLAILSYDCQSIYNRFASRKPSLPEDIFDASTLSAFQLYRLDHDMIVFLDRFSILAICSKVSHSIYNRFASQ